MTEALEHPAPRGVTIYYWPCAVVLLAPSLMLDRPTGPLSATLRLACAEPYMINVGGQLLTTRASLVAPKAPRKRIAALNSDLALFYLPVDAPEYAGVRQLLGDASLLDLDIDKFEPVLPLLRTAMHTVQPPAVIRQLVREVIALLTDHHTVPTVVDQRVTQACSMLDRMPLSEVSLQRVADAVHLSPSRLRDLFKRQTGFTIGDYARWRAVWRAALIWQRSEGKTMTEVALEAGFHDLAHADRAFIQVFGMNPSRIIDPKYVTLVDCELPTPELSG